MSKSKAPTKAGVIRDEHWPFRVELYSHPLCKIRRSDDGLEITAEMVGGKNVGVKFVKRVSMWRVTVNVFVTYEDTTFPYANNIEADDQVINLWDNLNDLIGEVQFNTKYKAIEALKQLFD